MNIKDVFKLVVSSVSKISDSYNECYKQINSLPVETQMHLYSSLHCRRR